MGGPHVDAFLGFRLDPAVEDTPAREHKRVRALFVEDGKLDVAIERRCAYRLPLPHHTLMQPVQAPRFDPDQIPAGEAASDAAAIPRRREMLTKLLVADSPCHARVDGVSA